MCDAFMCKHKVRSTTPNWQGAATKFRTPRAATNHIQPPVDILSQCKPALWCFRKYTPCRLRRFYLFQSSQKHQALNITRHTFV